MAPIIRLEPRKYYNLDKRVANNKDVSNNSANFIAMTFKYIPDWFIISNKKNINIYNQIFIAPKWGIKRNIGTHFHYELGLALGVKSYFGKDIGFMGKSTEASGELHIRIGYTF